MKIKFSASFFIALLFLSFVSFPAFSYGGYMSGQKNLRIVSTKYLDIIFPEKSREAASILVEGGDRVYEEIAERLGIEADFRIPVVITPSTDVFNAYYTNVCFNHIVMLDTLPGEDFEISENTFLETFRHELNHAVTINLRNGFWKTVDGIFGDVINWSQAVSLTSFWKEGASVAEESQGGFGRMHDGYYLHMVRQAKLSDKFPSYADVQGSRDVYPSGSSCYGFGGPFTFWLQEKFGMEKYADFWYRAVNLKAFTYADAFKKSYGFSMKEAWKDFKDSIFLPEISSSPEDSSASYLCLPNGKRPGKSALQQFNSASGNKFVFYDSATSTVYEGECGKEKARKLFTMTNVSRLNLSRDGKILAVSYYGINSVTVKNCLKLYLMDRGTFCNLPGTGLRDACVMKNSEGAYFLAAVRIEGQRSALEIYGLETESKKGELSSVKVKNEKLLSIPFGIKGDSRHVFSPSDAGNNILASIVTGDFGSGLEWKFAFFNLDNLFNSTLSSENDFSESENRSAFENVSGGIKKVFANTKIECTLSPLPLKGMRIRSLSCSENFISFSWCLENTFPRLGFVNIGELKEKGSLEYSWMKNDISGGIYYPLYFSEEESFIYSGNFFDRIELLSIEKNKIDFESQKSIYDSSYFSAFSSLRGLESEESEEKKDDKIYFEGEKSYFPHYSLKGLFIPAGYSKPYSFDFTKSRFSIQEMSLFDNLNYGVTWASQVPWDSDVIIASASYSLIKKEGGLYFNFSGNSETSVYKYNLDFQTLFDSDGFKQCSADLTFKSGWRLYGRSSIVFSLENFFLAGKEEYSKTDYLTDDWIENTEKIIFNRAKSSLLYSASLKTGHGYYEKLALEAGLSWRKSFVIPWGKIDSSSPFADLENTDFQEMKWGILFPALSLQLPYLIPVRGNGSITWNLPLIASGNFYGTRQNLKDGDTCADADLRLILFGMEVQKGFGSFPLYLKRLELSAEWEGDFILSTEPYYAIDIDYEITLKAVGLFCFNTGALTGTGLGLGLGLTYDPYGKSSFSLGFATSSF